MVSESTDIPRESRGKFLATADEIGRDVCSQAIWHEDRCNWIGATPEEGAGGIVVDSYASLSGDLYGGTSGVAIFLAHLHRATGDVTARDTALGAMRQALARADETLPPVNRGLYGGRAGLALAAAGVGRLMDRAVELGDELLDSARKSESGWSWSSPTVPTSADLTGFSHGAAGVGYALLELHRVTDDARYLEGAEQAFNYERGLFDPVAGNWPDLRQPRADWGVPGGPTYASFWCHGAPGIGLSRLRALEMLGAGNYRSEAEAALETTRRSVAVEIESAAANYSICHGLAGNAEVLLFGEHVLGAHGSEGARLAMRVADLGIRTYPERGLPWPCGTHGGESPSLFLGLAGIGFFYLRLLDPTIPSVLIPSAEAFQTLAAG